MRAIEHTSPIQNIPGNDINTRDSLQSCGHVRENQVEAYHRMMKTGASFPPLLPARVPDVPGYLIVDDRFRATASFDHLPALVFERSMTNYRQAALAMRSWSDLEGARESYLALLAHAELWARDMPARSMESYFSGQISKSTANALLTTWLAFQRAVPVGTGLAPSDIHALGVPIRGDGPENLYTLLDNEVNAREQRVLGQIVGAILREHPISKRCG